MQIADSSVVGSPNYFKQCNLWSKIIYNPFLILNKTSVKLVVSYSLTYQTLYNNYINFLMFKHVVNNYIKKFKQ